MKKDLYKAYYDQLNEIGKKNAPKELFWEGDFSLLTEGLRVSVVGSREASGEGLKRAEIITRSLVKRNITVVSGLALGIDTAAHKTAIENGGKTIAVLGTPLKNVYPKENFSLLDNLKKEHLVITQFKKEDPFHAGNFPMRNRTMALISDATVIVEATENSGVIYQGWESLRLGRDLFILQNVVSKGYTWVNQMLKYGAQILTRENMEFLFDDIHYLTISFLDKRSSNFFN